MKVLTKVRLALISEGVYIIDSKMGVDGGELKCLWNGYVFNINLEIFEDIKVKFMHYDTKDLNNILVNGSKSEIRVAEEILIEREQDEQAKKDGVSC